MTNADILRIAMEQHAIDANCSPNDFTRDDNVVVISQIQPLSTVSQHSKRFVSCA